MANKKNIDDSKDEDTILRFNQTLKKYLNVSVGIDKYHLIKYDKIQNTDATVIENPNTGGYLLQNWIKKCNDGNKIGKTKTFIK